jgi:hypothetical protein
MVFPTWRDKEIEKNFLFSYFALSAQKYLKLNSIDVHSISKTSENKSHGKAVLHIEGKVGNKRSQRNMQKQISESILWSQ